MHLGTKYTRSSVKGLQPLCSVAPENHDAFSYNLEQQPGATVYNRIHEDALLLATS